MTAVILSHQINEDSDADYFRAVYSESQM